jgi:hypothetical protein
MKSHQEGEWTVTTPVYVGSSAQVEEATKCPHEVFVEVMRTVINGTVLIQDKCSKCVATRARYRPATAEELRPDITPADICPLYYHKLSDPAHQECIKERRT